jgi:ATP-dependent Lon protease
MVVAEAPTNPPSALSIPDALPVLPLRGGMVVLPLSVTPLLVGQPRSIQLVDDVMRRERLLVLVAQRADKDQPGLDDLNRMGTAAIIHQLARLPDGSLRVVVQGLERVRLLDFITTEPYLVARVELAPDRTTPGIEVDALRRAAVDLFRRLASLVDEIPTETATAAEALQDARQVAYLIATLAPLPAATRQELLELDPLEAKVLPVGGIKEQVLAAHRSGIRTVILPRENERDLEDVPAELRREIEIIPVESAEEVLSHALESEHAVAASDGRTATRPEAA